MASKAAKETVYGRNKHRDEADYPKDSPRRFGFITQLELMVARPYAEAPQNLSASTRPAEHNTRKMPRFVPVSQLAAAQHGNRTIRTLVSHRVHLRPGTQSLGGT